MSRVRQDALALERVSRVPLREALRILEGEGPVSYVAHRGYFVTELSLSDLLEVAAADVRRFSSTRLSDHRDQAAGRGRTPP